MQSSEKTDWAPVTLDWAVYTDRHHTKQRNYKTDCVKLMSMWLV